MVGWSEELKFPLMAGSSLPVTWRRPELELRLETPVEDALVAGYGPIEVYGFHALEALQVMMERRKGGETGVKAVTCLTGKDVWKAGDAGQWSWDLLDAALGRSETVNLGDVRKNVGSMSVAGHAADAGHGLPDRVPRRHARHGAAAQRPRPGLHASPAKVKGEAKPASCLFHLPPPPGAKYFDALTWQHREDARNRQVALPGRAHAADDRHARRGDGKPSPRRDDRVETPELDVRYAAPADSGFLRGGVAADS